MITLVSPYASPLFTVSVATDIKTARERAGLTQEQASAQWDIPIQTLRHWEQGRHQPRGLAKRQLDLILSGAAGSPSKRSRKKA